MKRHSNHGNPRQSQACSEEAVASHDSYKCPTPLRRKLEDDKSIPVHAKEGDAEPVLREDEEL